MEKIVINNDISIESGEELRYSNKKIYLNSQILCKGKLIFENCEIIIGYMETIFCYIVVKDEAKFYMNNCTVTEYGKHYSCFLDAESDCCALNSTADTDGFNVESDDSNYDIIIENCIMNKRYNKWERKWKNIADIGYMYIDRRGIIRNCKFDGWNSKNGCISSCACKEPKKCCCINNNPNLGVSVRNTEFINTYIGTYDVDDVQDCKFTDCDIGIYNSKNRLELYDSNSFEGTPNEVVADFNEVSEDGTKKNHVIRNIIFGGLILFMAVTILRLVTSDLWHYFIEDKELFWIFVGMIIWPFMLVSYWVGSVKGFKECFIDNIRIKRYRKHIILYTLLSACFGFGIVFLGIIVILLLYAILYFSIGIIVGPTTKVLTEYNFYMEIYDEKTEEYVKTEDSSMAEDEEDIYYYIEFEDDYYSLTQEEYEEYKDYDGKIEVVYYSFIGECMSIEKIDE